MTKIETTNFKRLIGVWKTSGQILTENQTVNLSGTDSYELILDGNYILHKANVLMGTQRSETLEIISLTDTADKAKMQYFNSKGESGIMKSEITNNDFLIIGDSLKFSGTISDNTSEIIGKWFIQTDNKSWKEFIDLKLKKQN
jgi:hypothetical protein